MHEFFQLNMWLVRVPHYYHTTFISYYFWFPKNVLDNFSYQSDSNIKSTAKQESLGKIPHCIWGLKSK